VAFGISFPEWATTKTWFLLNSNIVRILEYGLKTNSYKFALLRSLAEIAQETTQHRPIPYQSLAEKFLNYYWPLTILFRIRQATDPTRDPVVMKFIRREAEGLKLSPFGKISTGIPDALFGPSQSVLPKWGLLR
jgi:hypothetical protein